MENENIQRCENIQRWGSLVSALGGLADSIVFVGAGIAGFIVDKPSAPNVRPTEDIDSIVDVENYTQLHAFERQLSQKGFKRSPEHNARWMFEEIVFDLMPVRPITWYVTNSWYQEALKSVSVVQLTKKVSVKMLSPAFFIATKLEAFNNRGALMPMKAPILRILSSFWMGEPRY